MQSDPVVFVVDDDKGALRATQWLLESEGLQVKAYPSAKEFLESYSPPQAGCLLLDFAMPEMNGLELAQRMTANGWSLPIIVVTGSGYNDPRVRKLANQVFGFVEKPSDPEELLSFVHRALKNEGNSGNDV